MASGIFATLGLEEFEDLDTPTPTIEVGNDNTLDAEVAEIEYAESVIDEQRQDASTLEQVAAAMEAAIVSGTGLNAQGAQFSRLCVSNIARRWNIQRTMSASMETYAYDPLHATRVSMESIRDVAKKMWDAFIAKMKALWEKIREFFGKTKSNAEHTEEEAKKNQQEAKADHGQAATGAPPMIKVAAHLVMFGGEQVQLKDFPRHMEKSIEALRRHIAASNKLAEDVLNNLMEEKEFKDMNLQHNKIVNDYITHVLFPNVKPRHPQGPGPYVVYEIPRPIDGTKGLDVTYRYGPDEQSGLHPVHLNVSGVIFEDKVITEQVEIESASLETCLAINKTAEDIARVVKDYCIKATNRQKGFDQAIASFKKQLDAVANGQSHGGDDELPPHIKRGGSYLLPRIENLYRFINKVDGILTADALAVCHRAMQVAKMGKIDF